MSKKRKLTLDKPESSEILYSGNQVTFDAFFQQCLILGLIKVWQEAEIRAFFRDLGLRDKEASDKYKDALKKF